LVVHGISVARPAHSFFSSRPDSPTVSPPFPYTPLFRSSKTTPWQITIPRSGASSRHRSTRHGTADVIASRRDHVGRAVPGRPMRSEEHTSELQSLRHLVCRVLLEKKILWMNLLFTDPAT